MMEIIFKQIAMIERMDRLIKLQATGAPEDFARRLGISKPKLYRMIRLMKKLEAPVVYDIALQSFVYTKSNVRFNFGFDTQNKLDNSSTFFLR
ncbi:hypothetical protein ABW636_09525 [Aquimarina sp. 2201CG1-2-11]|uniref:hypothetical protein n=1 Tax=Aquimarina discodermiae TaxID=3231043 RepID=UPI0034632338